MTSFKASYSPMPMWRRSTDASYVHHRHLGMIRAYNQILHKKKRKFVVIAPSQITGHHLVRLSIEQALTWSIWATRWPTHTFQTIGMEPFVTTESAGVLLKSRLTLDTVKSPSGRSTHSAGEST